MSRVGGVTRTKKGTAIFEKGKCGGGDDLGVIWLKERTVCLYKQPQTEEDYQRDNPLELTYQVQKRAVKQANPFPFKQQRAIHLRRRFKGGSNDKSRAWRHPFRTRYHERG